MNVLRAFVRRDFRVAVSYKVPFALDLLAAGFTVITFSFVAKLVPANRVPGGYLAFVMVGLAMSAFLQSGLTVLAGNLRQEQVQGTLETMLAGGVRVPLLGAGLAAYPIVSAALRAVLYLAFAAIAGARMPGANWGLAVLAAALGAVSFAGLGLVGAALTLVIRQTVAAVTWLVTVMTLAAGALFPARLLPGWARVLSGLSPFTQVLRLVRRALLERETWRGGLAGTGVLAALAILFVGVGIAALAGGLVWSKRTGALGQY